MYDFSLVKYVKRYQSWQIINHNGPEIIILIGYTQPLLKFIFLVLLVIYNSIHGCSADYIIKYISTHVQKLKNLF